ncbi:MAG: T9SS type A sorting domain-containing protein, partial [Tannerella sp.]|nr:T9SS type A sorting domain-containing protein [Tannerella sp.]
GFWDGSAGQDGGANVDTSPFFARGGFDGEGNMQEGDYRLTFAGTTTEGGSNRLLTVDPYPVNIVLGNPSPANTVYSDGTLYSDLDNENRIIYDYVDMGAYEYTRPATIDPIIQRRVLVPNHEGVRSTPPYGVYYVRGHYDFFMILYPREGYTLNNLRIVTGSAPLDEGGGTEMLRQADGSITVTFHNVVEPLDIQYLGVERLADVESGGVGVSPVEDGVRAIWSEGGRLYVELPSGDRSTVKIYGLTGQLYRQQEITGGRTSFPLAPGMYIVSLNDGLRQKIIIR